MRPTAKRGKEKRREDLPDIPIRLIEEIACYEESPEGPTTTLYRRERWIPQLQGQKEPEDYLGVKRTKLIPCTLYRYRLEKLDETTATIQVEEWRLVHNEITRYTVTVPKARIAALIPLLEHYAPNWTPWTHPKIV